MQKLLACLLLLTVSLLSSCLGEFEPIEPPKPEGTDTTVPEEEEDDMIEVVDIDLSHWKVTLPIGDDRPIEVKPPEILDYANMEVLKEFMYNDSSDASLVFHTYPGGATTANSSYPRTELREQMISGSNTTNWTFAQGGRMKGRLALADISKDANGNYHRTIIMQIHGRLTDEQRDLIGEDDNNAPPILKIYWANGLVRVKTKVLNDPQAEGEELLPTSAWGDDDGFNFSERVNFEPFTLEVIASDGRLEVILNDNESVVYEDANIRKWGVFENYFKAGNYLASVDTGAFATVKYYSLEVEH